MERVEVGDTSSLCSLWLDRLVGSQAENGITRGVGLMTGGSRASSPMSRGHRVEWALLQRLAGEDRVRG